MSNKKLLIIVSLIFLPILAEANIQKDMAKFFDNQGYSVNANSAGAFKDQSGGYYTGGSIMTRRRTENYNLMSLHSPSMKSGCGNIDLHFGGFSFIDSQALLKLMNSIGSQAAGFALSIALQQVSPQIKSAIDQLLALAQDVNNMNINSCNAAATLVGSAWPKTEASSKVLCQAIGMEENKFKDYAAARQGCGADGKRQETIGNKKGNFADQLGEEYNLVWKALKKNDLFKDNDSLAEIFMSFSGTIIAKRFGSGANATIKPVPWKQLVTKQETLKAIVEGGELVVYRCDNNDEDACLNPKDQLITINPSESLNAKVKSILSSMLSKLTAVDEGGGATETEIGLVNSTKIPIFKIIAIQAAFTENRAPVAVEELSEIIAYDLLFNYLERVVEVVSESLNHLRMTQINKNDLQEFNDGLQLSRSLIVAKRQALYHYFNTVLSVIERTQLIEQQLNSTFHQQD